MISTIPQTTTEAFSFADAINGAQLLAFAQELDLRYCWIMGAAAGFPAADALGRRDDELLPQETADEMTRQKRAVIETGQRRQFQIGVTQESKRHWLRVTVNPRRAPSGQVCGIIGTIIDVTEEREAESRLRLAMRELAHRSKNLLAVVQAMARQTATHSENLEAFSDRFSLRIAAFSNSHDLLVHGGWQGASLRELVASQLGHFVNRIGSVITLEGPEVRLNTQAAQNIGMALHELATNAAKHGALSTPEGRVSIGWSMAGEGQHAGDLIICWQEHHGPPVRAPARRGFGHVVIERLAARSIGGTVHLDYRREGLFWSLTVPAHHLLSDLTD